MHRTDIIYRLPSLPTQSLIELEQSYRMADEMRECRGNFNYNRMMQIKICLELMRRGIGPINQKEAAK